MGKWVVRALVLATVLVIAAGTAAVALRTRALEPFRGYAGVEQFVAVAPGSGPATIRGRLVGAGVVRDDLTYRVALWLTGRARQLKAGEYRFAEPLSAVEVIERIARGEIYTRPVTFREGLMITEMADVYAAAGLGRRDAFLAAATDVSLIRDLDAEATDLEGYLFPDTYLVPRQTPATTLVAQMVRGFRAALPPALIARAAADGLSVRQVVTLAALVEKETAQDVERPIVAAVYRNRHRIGMGMQADPTVIYALQRAGKWDGNLSRADLAFDSPYNTYRYGGLPPGPIAAPGRRALEAVVSPAAVDYLYFVSRNDGTHVFAETLPEHNRNVFEWQVKYFRERRARERAERPGAR
ncbi:MAG TPA: endolytic transglycosylase MltG [Vicinamibacterales bacterium]|nr:endolytic transglycosylase MltG [Vicinamibacterales bacterium]